MSYWNQPMSGWGGSVFTIGSWAPTGATPTTPAFYFDDTNNQFYAYNGSAWEAETDRTVGSWAPTWATPTNPPFYWDDVANKLYLWNGAAWETSSVTSWWDATWGTSYNIDLMSYPTEVVSAKTWRNISVVNTWKYYIYAKISEWQYSWTSQINIYTNVAGTLTLIENFLLWWAYRDSGAVFYLGWLSKEMSITWPQDIFIEYLWAGTPATLHELKLVFWPQRPNPVVSYLSDFQSNSFANWAWVVPTQSPTWSAIVEQPFNPAISFDPITARYAALWPASNELTMTETWTYNIRVNCYWACDFPWIWWFPAGNKYDLYVNGAMVQSVWVWSNTWFFCSAHSEVTFTSVSITAWDIIYIRKTQWTIWFLWTFDNNIFIYKI